MKMIKAIIFDLDGTLVDTEPLHYASYKEAFKKYGVDLTEEQFYEHWTKKGKGVKDFLVERRINLDIESFRTQKRKLYHAKLQTAPLLIEGVTETLSFLNQKYRLAIATSSWRVDAELVLQRAGIAQYFKTIVTANEVKKEKPFPDCFLLVASILNIPPQEAIVIEDSEKGIIAAHRAGMKSVAIPNQYTLHHDFSLATRILSNIREVPSSLTEKIINNS